MEYFKIVAHRGITTKVPENTIEAFKAAIKLGADSVEFDVRLTADNIPVVYHYFYLDEITDTSGPIFNFALKELQKVNIITPQYNKKSYKIPSLETVLKVIGGKIGLEIELKGPEYKSVEIISDVLKKYDLSSKSLEITSYEPLLLRNFHKKNPEIKGDLLFPQSEIWMKSDVISYLAVHRALLAKARAVHLHPSQLNQKTVSMIRKKNIEIHAWDVNDNISLGKIEKFEIEKICTDNFNLALDYRNKLIKTSK